MKPAKFIPAGILKKATIDAGTVNLAQQYMLDHAALFNLVVKATRVGGEFDRLESLYGVLTPSVLLKEARDEKSPLHRVFPWEESDICDMLAAVIAHTRAVSMTRARRLQ